MWVVALFDLPVETKENRRDYRRFHDALITDGFTMLQYSVYARPCPSPENADLHMKRVERFVPPEGEVRALTLTSLQFSRMKVYFGKKPRKPESEPQQLSFF